MKLRYFSLIAAAAVMGAAAAIPVGFGFRIPSAAYAACAPKSPCAANPCAANPCAAKNPCAANPCAANPCAANPCAAKNPCAANPCAANPCAANPCAANPCAANPCAANPCAANPCAAKNPCAANPCAANPCAANPCAANPCAANPCAGGGEKAIRAEEKANAEYAVNVEQIDGKNVIKITQTPCQFLESEGIDLNFSTASASDCAKINTETASTRTAQPVTLKAGEYTFRVTNDNVPYEVGFYLRGTGLGRVTLPSISGGGLTEGTTKDYTVTLKPGQYVYNCPLNPTLNYPLTVVS